MALKVKLIAHTPNPEEVVAQAAKLCYSQVGVDGIMEKLTPEKIENFVDHLATIHHESPLEHVSFTFAIEGASRTCSHQFVRHRIASYSQQSQRYVKLEQFEYIVPPEIEKNEDAKKIFIETMEKDQQAYDELVMLLIVDKIDNKVLPEQTYTFTAYLIVVDSNKKTIKLDNGDTNSIIGEGKHFTFNYEAAYNIKAQVVEIKDKNENPVVENSDSYKYYATGLPDGLSMTVDGFIGGKLSGSGAQQNGSFDVFAVSISGDTVTIKVDYTVAGHTIRDFDVTYGASNNQYATIRIGESVTLKVTPSGTYDMTGLTATSSGTVVGLESILKEDNKSGTISFTCEGTGINVITISAQVDGVKIVKTFTVYVVGKIFNTDLDPEVTN